ncbi:hypothetical protein [Alicyclobacillus tolerans]|uniref:Uncharacterized protein n=1 Tax=Alicyclobacillus tolerans TaxID=90970 RepID=A0ABT9LVC8_9BACL|nr:hypothetical protein [Alicyclobacillus tengchongensis]MDP9728227.1 hypothetical protein [Alicyclobacillus tengchongensis]
MIHFPSVKSLRGELKRSEIRGNMRYQLTTKEFIQQRESHTYRIALQNILGMTECDEKEAKNLKMSWTNSSKYGKLYKIVANAMFVILPNSVVEQRSVQFYTWLSPAFAEQMEALLSNPVT